MIESHVGGSPESMSSTGSVYDCVGFLEDSIGPKKLGSKEGRVEFGFLIGQVFQPVGRKMW